jgi:hypothetical protein
MSEELRVMTENSILDLQALLCPEPTVRHLVLLILCADKHSLCECVCVYIYEIYVCVCVFISYPQAAPAFKGFVIRALLDDTAIRFDPDFSQFESVLVGLAATVLGTVSHVPR